MIIFAHAGLEDEINPLPEWQDVYRNFIDLGAYAIIASHPHIVQGFEIYKGRYIFYSLGNFAFDLNKNNQLNRKEELNWNRGLVVEVDTLINSFNPIVTLYKDGSVLKDTTVNTDEMFMKLNTVIYDRDKLEKIAFHVSEELFNSYYHDYWINVCPLKKRDYIKLIFNKLLHKKNCKQIDLSWLYHNLMIETNRFIAERYLSQIDFGAN